MKRKMFILIALLLTFGYPNSTWACEVEIDTHESTKKVYQINAWVGEFVLDVDERLYLG